MSVAMHDTSPIRLGIVRPATGSGDPLVAEIEPRVLAYELARRLGPVSLDLRTDGDAIGRWLPLAHAAWPAAIDAQLDAAALWSSSVPLTALITRTIEPAAAEVRARMLAHLGLIPADPAPLGADRLAELAALSITPTDLWLVARAATAVDTGVAELDAVVTPVSSPGIAVLDAGIDALLAGTELPGAATVGRLQGELTALRARVTELEAEARRTAVETAGLIDDLVHERAVLRERLDRAQFDLDNDIDHDIDNVDPEPVDVAATTAPA